MAKQQFGISTGLYLGRRLQREHLVEIRSHGFEAVEIVAAADHVDCTNPAVVANLQQWLAEAQLVLHTVTVPAGADDAAAEAALHVARRIPVSVLALQVGAPKDAAKLVERLAQAAEPLQVTIAVDSRSESMKPIGSLAHFIERGVDATVGVALDCESAHKAGDLVDAIEIVSEHLVAVRVPVESRIDWATALTTLRKVGYEGPLTFDGTARGSPADQLRRAREARQKLAKWL